ncbi:MAG: SufD family Fe-S cluster assembly protein [Candidatus Levybacteria bacterium]|nr:SufD family Fe-S cluster assembly protein [Candidatus Levybacteria bacterium]
MKQIKIVVRKNEEKLLPIFWLNNKEKEIQITARLVGDNSRLTIVGIFFGDSANSVVFNTDVTHEGLHTKSLTFVRAVFKDTASFNNDGMVRIRKGAKNANGYFNSKVLLFDDAKGRSVPSLEIDENEVKAGHASTIGRPDENQLFYLKSRGLSEREAQELIISGFFMPAIEKLPAYEQNTNTKKLLRAIGTGGSFTV